VASFITRKDNINDDLEKMSQKELQDMLHFVGTSEYFGDLSDDTQGELSKDSIDKSGKEELIEISLKVFTLLGQKKQSDAMLTD
jgi:hypothetical protein